MVYNMKMQVLSIALSDNVICEYLHFVLYTGILITGLVIGLAYNQFFFL